MKRTISLTLTAAVALAAGTATATLPGCTTLTCQVVGVVFPDPGYTVALQDSLLVSATTLTDCPDRISPAVNFSSSNPSIFTTRTVNDTLVVVKGVTVGTAQLQGVSKDRPNLKATTDIMIIGANP